MAKQGGLGMACYVDGHDVSGDIGTITSISTPMKPIDTTSIKDFGNERIGGQRDASMQFTAYFNPDMADGAHAVFSSLPTADRGFLVSFGTAVGSPAACMGAAKQLNYDPTRGTDGSLTEKITGQANGFALDWATLATGAGASIRTDAAATNGADIDGAAVTNFGLQAYLHVAAFTGTDVTVKLQDSADGVTYADLAAATFAQITSTTPQAQRLATPNTATIRRHLRVSTVTTGGFTSVSFVVAFTRNTVAGVAF